MPIAAQYRAQDGRHTASGTYRGIDFEVATAFSIEKDHFPIHVYIGSGVNRRRVPLVGAHGVSIETALSAGLGVVKQEVDEGRWGAGQITP